MNWIIILREKKVKIFYVLLACPKSKEKYEK